MPRADICSQLIGWDNNKGRAMKAAKTVLTKPKKMPLVPYPQKQSIHLPLLDALTTRDSGRENYSVVFKQ